MIWRPASKAAAISLQLQERLFSARIDQLRQGGPRRQQRRQLLRRQLLRRQLLRRQLLLVLGLTGCCHRTSTSRQDYRNRWNLHWHLRCPSTNSWLQPSTCARCWAAAAIHDEFAVTGPPVSVDELLAAVAAALKSDELVYLKKAING